MRSLRESHVARRLAVRTVAIDDRVDLIGRLPEGEGVAWVRHGEGLVGWGEAARFDPGAGEGRFERANDQVLDWFEAADVSEQVNGPGTGPVAFGSFTFDPGAYGSVVVVPSVVIGRRDGVSWLTRIGEQQAADEAPPNPPPPGASDRVRYGGSTIPELAWLEAVARAEAAARRGDVDKVVLARDVLVWSKSVLDVRSILARLTARFPQCYTFCCDGLVGATPELLVRTSGEEVESVVLAGSAPRGPNEEEDRRLGDALLASPKDLREHELGVRSVAEVMGELCSEVDSSGPSLLRLANVQHLSTSFRGRFDQTLTSLQVAGRLHPTAAVCGLPRNSAHSFIGKLEGMDRGRYSGPVGWMDSRGDGEWGIALRCAEIDGNRGRLFAGCGIVEGSVPEAELEETRLKLRAMQSALDPT